VPGREGRSKKAAKRNDFAPWPLSECRSYSRETAITGNRMPEDFARPNCDSASNISSDAAEDDDRMVCPACGTLLATRAEFRRFVEWSAMRSKLHTSRC
jgi:hypothetical protein